MSEYARQVWQDCFGDLHDTEEEAREASRRFEINKRMEVVYVGGNTAQRQASMSALRWFLEDAEAILEAYRGICGLVDDLMEDTP